MNTLKSLILVTLLLCGLGLLAGCSDDDSPTAPAPEPPAMVELTWKANGLSVIRDCDSTDARAEGDFHISFRMHDVTGGEEVPLAEKKNVIIKASDGEYLIANDLNIVAKAEVPLKNGTRVLLRMSIYENDPDGPQVSTGQGFYYTYSTVSNRWESEDDEGGVTFGTFDSWKLDLNDGATCNVDLYGRFSQNVIFE
jgi:hypothetical protein